MAALSGPQHLPRPGGKRAGARRAMVTGAACRHQERQAHPRAAGPLRGQPAAGITEGIVFPQQPVCFPTPDIAGRALKVRTIWNPVNFQPCLSFSTRISFSGEPPPPQAC